MSKLIFAALLFTQSLFAFDSIPVKYEWTPTCYFSLDIDKECIFYDAWNDVIEIMKPRDYMRIMYNMDFPVVITHYMPIPQKPVVNVCLKECLE